MVRGSPTTGNEVTQASALPLWVTLVKLLPLSGPHQRVWAEMSNKQDVCIQSYGLGGDWQLMTHRSNLAHRLGL